MREVQIGRRVTRFGWADRRAWVAFMNGYLSIHLADGRDHVWHVTETDIFNDDWMVVPEADEPLAVGPDGPIEAVDKHSHRRRKKSAVDSVISRMTWRV